MKKNYWYIVFFAAFAFFMMSCADDEIIETPFISSPSKTIAFNADIEWPEPDQTRSASPNRVSNFSLLTDTGEEVLPCGVYVQDGIYPNNDEKPLTRGAVINSIGSSFNVWATYTDDEGSSSAYFSNLQFTKGSGDVFSSQGTTYYWPGSGTIDFVAVANTPSSGFTPKMSSGKLESFTYTVPTEATDQSDIIVATAKNVAGNKNASVPLSFKHIMSAVNVKIGKVVPGEIRSITFKNVYNKGEYLVDQGVWVVDKTSTENFAVVMNDNAVTMEDNKFVSSGSNAKDTPVNTAKGTFMFIPQNPGENAEMVIEFYDSSTGRLYSDEAGADKPALRGTIADDNWEKGKTTNYMLSIDESFTLTIEPVGKKLDAHYIISQLNVTVDGIKNWTIEAKASDGADVTIQREVDANPLAKQGFWTDKVVDSEGKIKSESARGSLSYSGTGSVTNMLFYLFIPENIGNTDREIRIILKGTGNASASTTKVLVQKCPNWTDGGFGWEVVDDDESGKYGFKWTRKVIFEHKYGWTRWFTGNGTGSWYKRNTAAEYANSLIAQYNAYAYATYGYFANNNLGGERMYIYIDYTKLNNLSTSNSSNDGFSNTIALFNHGGGAASQAFETAILTAEKTTDDEGYKDDPLAFRNMDSVKDKDSGVTYTADNGSLNDLSGILTYVLKKNRYYMQTTYDGYTTTLHPIISEDDIKWYLPAYGQFQYFTPDPNIAGDNKANYWSSTAVDGASQAYIGDGTPKDRDLKYRVIAVRKDENGYGNATVQVNNGSLAGGENGNSDTWVE